MSKVKNIKAILTSPQNVTSDDLDQLVQIAQNVDSIDIKGECNIQYMYKDTYDALREKCPDFKINVGQYYLPINDSIARKIIAETWGDGTGVYDKNVLAAVTSLGTIFRNTDITDVSWTKYFTGLKGSLVGAFLYTNKLEDVKLYIPSGVTQVASFNHNIFANQYEGARPVKKLDCTDWDLSNVTYIKDPTYNTNIFTKLTNAEEIDITNIFKKPYPNYSDVFRFPKLKIIKGLDTINVTGCTNFSRMFYGLSSEVTEHTVDLTCVESFNVSSGINFSEMFAYSNIEQKLDLTNWDMSNATNIKGIFRMSHFTELDLHGWDTSKVTTFGNIWGGGNYTINSWLTKVDIRGWDTVSATSINDDYLSERGPISNLTSFVCSPSLFNCCSRAENPITTLNIFNIFTGWVDQEQIDAVLNMLPEITDGVERKLQLSKNTKSAASTEAIATANSKGWTII